MLALILLWCTGFNLDVSRWAFVDEVDGPVARVCPVGTDVCHVVKTRSLPRNARHEGMWFVAKGGK